MAIVAASGRVVKRNNIGRFISRVEAAATETIEDTVKQGAALASTLAPRRTGALAASIQPVVLSRTSGIWGSDKKYALPQERGASAHTLPANVTFFWEREGRMWMPPDVYLRVTGHPGNDPIQHPGNPGTHFLRDSYHVVSRRMMSIAERHYPGH